MHKLLIVLGMAGLLQATDVVNLDKASYKIKVEALGGEGYVVTSFHQVAAGANLSDLCGAASCTFEIPDSRVTVKKDDRLVIHHGRLIVETPVERK